MIAELENFNEIQFRRIPDEKGDNESFLSLLLKDDKTAESLADKLKEEKIPCAYWFKNNWHYIRVWHHFKELKNNEQLYKEQRDLLLDYKNHDFIASVEIMSRVVFVTIALNW